MFLLSSTNFQQAYKRLQYIKQYANYQKKQGEEIKVQTVKLQDLNKGLVVQKQDKQKLIEENRAAKKEDPFEVWGSGKQGRDFVHIEDVMDCTLLAMEHIHDGSAINIGQGRLTSFLEIIELFTKILRVTTMCLKSAIIRSRLCFFAFYKVNACAISDFCYCNRSGQNLSFVL